MMWDATVTMDDKTLYRSSWLTMASAIYPFVRGLDNMSQGSPRFKAWIAKRSVFKPREEPVPFQRIPRNGP